MCVSKGIALMVLLVFLLMLGSISLIFFNDTMVSLKLTRAMSNKEIAWAETDSCLQKRVEELAGRATPWIESTHCTTLSCVQDFSPQDWTQVSMQWFKKQGILCDKKVFIYMEIWQTFPEEATYFYRLTGQHRSGLITRQLSVSKNFNTGKTMRQSYWVL